MVDRYMPNQHKLDLHVVDSHRAFAILGIEVQPYPVPHDAREPIQCVFSDGDKRLGVLTDVGRSTPHIEQTLSACHALVLECNHDAAMLKVGPYSRSLKERVGGDLGHLENLASANILAKLDKNNTPDLAKQALAGVLNCQTDWVAVADQALGLDWREIA
jgi:phosphoribosyl 1,2-cyclic phosphodiesterase